MGKIYVQYMAASEPALPKLFIQIVAPKSEIGLEVDLLLFGGKKEFGLGFGFRWNRFCFLVLHPFLTQLREPQPKDA